MTKILGNFLVNAENGVVDATGMHTISNFGVKEQLCGIATLNLQGLDYLLRKMLF